MSCGSFRNMPLYTGPVLLQRSKPSQTRGNSCLSGWKVTSFLLLASPSIPFQHFQKGNSFRIPYTRLWSHFFFRSLLHRPKDWPTLSPAFLEEVSTTLLWPVPFVLFASFHASSPAPSPQTIHVAYCWTLYKPSNALLSLVFTIWSGKLYFNKRIKFTF